MRVDATVAELILLDGLRAARILCPPQMIPAPGKYLLAHANASDAPLAASVFAASSFAGGFLAAPPVPDSWIPGTHLHLRGPLGNGFVFPEAARRVGLIAFDDSPRRLLALLNTALKQDASVTLVCEKPPEDLPLQVEVQPLSALPSRTGVPPLLAARTVSEVCAWADYVAMDAARESLPELKSMLGMGNPLRVPRDAQILIRAPMPCGALAECGVCTVETHGGRRLVCDDGPVFDLRELI